MLQYLIVGVVCGLFIASRGIIIYKAGRLDKKKADILAEDQRLRRLISGNITELAYADKLIDDCLKIQSE